MISLLLGALLGGAAHSTPPPAALPVLPAPVASTDAELSSSADLPTPAVRARGSLPGLFTTDDYPLEALRKEEKGTVTFRIWIDRKGRVTRCVITESSGSPSLDSTTCRVVQSRARFTPARDARGRAVEDSTSGRIQWDLPVSPPQPFADRHERMIFSIDAKGRVATCRAETSDVMPPPPTICIGGVKIAEKIVAVFGGQLSFASRDLILEMGMVVGGPSSALYLGRASGEHLVTMTAVAVTIAASGAIAQCVAADGNMSPSGAQSMCARVAKAALAPIDAAANDRSDRHAVVYQASFTRPWVTPTAKPR